MHWAGIKPVRARPAQCGDRVALPPGMAQWGEGQGEDISIPQEWPRALGTCGKRGLGGGGEESLPTAAVQDVRRAILPFCTHWVQHLVQS